MPAKDFFATLETRVDRARLESINQSFLFHIDGAGSWFVDVREGKLTVTEGDARPADVTIRTSAETFERILAGKQSATTAYMTGKIKLEGDLGAAMKLQKLF